MNTQDTITSAANPRIRQAAALRDAPARRATGLTLVDGRRELSRAVAAGVEVLEVFVDARRLAGGPPDDTGRPAAEWLASLAARGARVVGVPERIFGKVAFGGRNEGVVAVARYGPRSLADAGLRTDSPVLVVEGVEKPGNLGAILRTADAAGLGGVIACDARTDVANPAVIRASLGTAFTVPTACCTTAEAIAWCRPRRVVAATPAAGRPWHEADLRGPVAILLGSEAVGISAAWDGAAGAGDLRMDRVRLPMHGVADSLNLSATAAVLAYEALRQREAVR